jgi:catechol 2,3-dioxygenase-like lactoylglutathione lyase family enzyme
MLSNLDAHTMIAAQDIARATQFYREQLGLPLTEELPGLFVGKGPSGSSFHLFASPLAGTAKNAVMGWKTPNLEMEVATLKARGVKFEEYNLPNFTTVDSIVTTPLGRSAWFKDTEGNMLGLAQY